MTATIHDIGECAARAAEGRLNDSQHEPDAFDASRVTSLATLMEEGRRIKAEGIRYVVEDVLPDYGLVGFAVAQATGSMMMSAMESLPNDLRSPFALPLSTSGGTSERSYSSGRVVRCWRSGRSSNKSAKKVEAWLSPM